MCGIGGEIRFDSTRACARAAQAMADRMATRGPDAAGLFLQGGIALAHRRLKIIDLSDASQQPMVDNALGLAIVFNGAIYNYRELRRELKAQGYRFFSSGDTEVLLKAYHAWGENFVEKLNGMFALAIWERDTGRLVLVRDRLGIKPLYYAGTDRALRFASSLPALLAAGGIDTEIDPVALHHYMSFHAVVPAPHTIIKGVRKLPPATVMVVEPSGERRETVYWRPAYGSDPEERWLTVAETRDRVLMALRRAVERRLVADVPVGVLLSGGLDSSLVVALLAEAGQRRLKTFSIGFESVGADKGDEFAYSDIVASHFGTDHERIFVPTESLLPVLPDCIAAMSEPMVSHDVIGFYLLSEAVSRHVTVVQSGQGADEVFGGYHWYPPLLDSEDAVSDYARLFMDRDHAEFAEAIDTDFVNGDHSLAFIRDHFAADGAPRAIDKALRIDTTVMLVDDPVKRVDNMTMAWGLEARVPFLDHELVELAARVRAEWKVADGGKRVLKEAARRLLPDAVIDRPKGYFPVPALKSIRGDCLAFVRDVLEQPAARRRTLLRRDYVDTLLADPEAHITPLAGSKLWQVALLETWLQTHGL